MSLLFIQRSRDGAWIYSYSRCSLALGDARFYAFDLLCAKARHRPDMLRSACSLGSYSMSIKILYIYYRGTRCLPIGPCKLTAGAELEGFRSLAGGVAVVVVVEAMICLCTCGQVKTVRWRSM